MKKSSNATHLNMTKKPASSRPKQDSKITVTKVESGKLKKLKKKTIIEQTNLN